MKEFVFRYKFFTMPFWYSVMIEAENSEKAVDTFIRKHSLGVETFRVVAVYDGK